MSDREADDVKARVGAIELFEGLPGGQIAELASICLVKKYVADSLIFSAGEEASGLYAVASGRVRVYRASPSGKEQILHVFGGGEAFGEVAVFQGKTYPANAQTVEPSEILFFPRDKFLGLILDDPELAMNMLALLSGRLRGFVARIEQLSLKEVPARLAGYLLLASQSAESDTVRLDLTKSQVAAYLGTIPETLSRALKRHEEAGIISITGREIRILDPGGLKEAAEQGR